MKWGILIDQFQKLSFKKKINSVFMGLSVGFLTPNRIGDFAGRLRYIRVENRLESIHASFVASIYQTAVTLLVGSCGFVYWMNQEVLDSDHLSLIYAISGLTILALLVLVFRMKLLILIAMKVKWLSKFSDRFDWFLSIDRKELQKVFALAFLRYLIFLFQYYLIVIAFNVAASPLLIVSSISTIYLLTTIIPTSTFSDILLRGAVSLLIFGVFIASEEVILLITATIWLINIVIPSLMGSVLFIFNRSK